MQIEIKSLSNSGDGIGYINDKKVFIPLSIPGDVVEIKIKNENAKFIKAELVKVIKSSADRIKPLCKYFSECGGCTLQHLNDTAHYKFKENVIKHSISYAGYDVPKDIEIKKTSCNERRRCVFKVDFRGQKISFYKKESNDLVNIDSCIVLDRDLESLIAPLNKLLKTLKSTKIKEISLTKVDNGIECLFITDKKFELEDINDIITFAKEYNIISVGYKAEKEKFITLISEFLKPQLYLGKYKISIPQGSFLQASIKGQNFIIDEIQKNLTKEDKVLDLYSGIGTYTFSIVDIVKNVKAIEGDDTMLNSILKNVKGYKLSDHIKCEKRDLYKNPVVAKELSNFDVVIINPPRNGATPQCIELANSYIKKIIMVSCNPFTFSNDAKILKNGGYKLQNIIGVDQFYRSPHIEVVAIFTKDKSVNCNF